MSRRMGLDAWAIGIHVFVTVTLAVALAELVGSAGNMDDILVPSFLGLSAVVFEWRRRRALAAHPPEGLTTGEVHLERLDELESRMADVEVLHARVAELEERLDFSERLLARGRQEEEAIGQPRYGDAGREGQAP